MFDPKISARAQEWLSSSYDETTKAQVRAWMEGNSTELNDAFYADLSFGTAGLRGLMGVGTTRINSYTIQIATQGLANYILKHSKNKKVFISFVEGVTNHVHDDVLAHLTGLECKRARRQFVIKTSPCKIGRASCRERVYVLV